MLESPKIHSSLSHTKADALVNAKALWETDPPPISRTRRTWRSPAKTSSTSSAVNACLWTGKIFS